MAAKRRTIAIIFNDSQRLKMIYYDLHGNKIAQDEFIKLYNNIYYYLNDYKSEAKIEKIYKRNYDITSEEIVSFLRWKVGDKEKRDSITTQYGAKINLSEFDRISKDAEICKGSKDTKELYQAIVDKKVKNVGAVYTLALVSVITKEEPIYDKFAKIAIDAIQDENCGFREVRDYTELPEKTNIKGVMEKYAEYKEQLVTTFGNAWKTNRDIDRALWTYGHLFQ